MHAAGKLRPDLIVRNIGKLHTMDDALPVLTHAAVACDKGRIVWIGADAEASRTCDLTAAKTCDAAGALGLPGLIDAHTHFLFAGYRQNEYTLRLQGKSYADIAAAGGGIASSVEALRRTDDTTLLQVGRERLQDYLQQGVTTIEAKSGYGLSTHDELRTLRLLRQLNNESPLEIVSTFLGAHWVPKEYAGKRTAYLDCVVKEMLPAVVAEKLAVLCDVFCDSIAFTAEESAYVLRAAKELGLGLKLHTDEFANIGGADIAAELGATSADHLCKLQPAQIDKLAKHGVVGVVLPGTTFNLRLEQAAPAREMLKRGMRVAVATDFNPGSNTCQNLPLTGSIAAAKFGMTPLEIARGMTLEAAAAIDREDDLGSLRVGKRADIALFNAPDIDFLFYYYGKNHLQQVIKDGKVAYSPANSTVTAAGR